MTIPVVAKAKRLGRLAKEHEWTGSFSSKIIDGQRITEIKGSRNDERFLVTWNDDSPVRILYQFFKVTKRLNSVSELVKRIESWPDVTGLIATQPGEATEILRTYQRCPIDFHSSTDDEIIDAMLGCELSWWSRISGKISTDKVTVPRSASARKNTYVKRFNDGRIIFNFIGHYGFRSVLVDSIVSVK